MMLMDCASWNWFSAGSFSLRPLSLHSPRTALSQQYPKSPCGPVAALTSAAPWLLWGMSLFSCVTAKENGSKNIIMQNGEDTTGATWLQFFAGEQEKRREICPFQLLYVSVIWRRTQLHDNRNNRGTLISISLGKRLFPSSLSLGLGQKQEY